MERVNGVIKFLKSPYLSLVVATLGITILFAPESQAATLGFSQIRNNHIVLWNVPARTIIGLGTVIFTISFIYQGFIGLWNWNEGRRIRSRILKSLNFLSSDQRLLLKYCISQNQQTISLEITDNAALALVSKRILYAGQQVNILAVPFTVQPFVWDHILENPRSVFLDDNPEDPLVRAELESYHRHVTRYMRRF